MVACFLRWPRMFGHKPCRSTPEPRVSYLSGRRGAVRREALCTTRPCGQYGRDGGPVSGPRNAATASSSSPSLPDLIRGGTSFRGDQHKAPASPDRRTYVLDTSVLLADPNALSRFDEHEVVLPIVVVTELEAKRHHPELGYFARQALRLLDEFRVRHGRLDLPIPIGDLGGTVRVELDRLGPQRPAQRVPPGGQRLRILAVARNLQAEGYDVTVVSKDLPLRIKASSVGLLAEEYRAGAGHHGLLRLDRNVRLGLSGEQVDILFEEGHAYVPEAADLPVHTGLTIQSERGKALGRVTSEGDVRLVRGDREAFGIKGRSAEQRIALDLLLDPDIGIVSMGGRAGTGKSALALCAGLEAVLERRQHQKVMVFRPLYAVGGRTGYLPAPVREDEPLGAHRHAVGGHLARGHRGGHRARHAGGPAAHPHPRPLPARRLRDRGRGPVTGTEPCLLTVLSRIGANSRVVLTHDVAQRTILASAATTAWSPSSKKLKGHPLFAHVTLNRSERSRSRRS